MMLFSCVRNVVMVIGASRLRSCAADMYAGPSAQRLQQSASARRTHMAGCTNLTAPCAGLANVSDWATAYMLRSCERTEHTGGGSTHSVEVRQSKVCCWRVLCAWLLANVRVCGWMSTTSASVRRGASQTCALPTCKRRLRGVLPHGGRWQWQRALVCLQLHDVGLSRGCCVDPLLRVGVVYVHSITSFCVVIVRGTSSVRMGQVSA